MPEPPSPVGLPDARAFLVERFELDSETVEFVGEGAWSRCYGFTHNGSELVVRFGRHLDDFERDRFAAHFAARDLPIPQVLEIDEAFGGWYCVSTRAHGHPLEQLNTDEWMATAPSVLSTLDAMRRVDLSTTKGYGEWNRDGNAPHGSWGDYLTAVVHDLLGSRIFGWRERLIDSPIGVKSFDRAHAQMRDLAEAFPGPRSLVHNDMLNRNVLAASGSITALFDWGCSIYGDFVYELATFVFWSPWHPVIERTDMTSRALDHYADMGLDVPNFDARMRCCALHIGLVHLAYNAFLRDEDTLLLTNQRMAQFVD
ncbi:MAG: aminoglycoside phosphotransferase family protein [Ilumatobacteraceae bacterium]